MDIGSLYPCPHTTGGKSKAKKGTAKQTKQSKHKKLKKKTNINSVFIFSTFMSRYLSGIDTPIRGMA